MSGPITPPLTVTTASGTPSGRPITTIKVSDGDLTISGNVATIDTSGGGAAAPADAEYLLAFDATIPAALTAARKLVIGGNISFYHGAGANDDVTIKAVPSETGGAVEGQIQFATSNTFDGIEEFYFDKTAGALYAGTNVTNGDASITILADGTGEPTLNLSNPSAAVSLTCDTNQQLKLEGGLNTFIFDASSATGGITWPDGTTQITAASGGGNDFNVELCGTELDASGTGYAVYDVMALAPYGVARFTTANIDTKQYFFPFISPFTGDVGTMYYNITSAAGSATNLYIAIYSDNNGVPDAVAGYATIDATVSGSQTTTSFSSTISLTRGTQYYIAYNKSTTQAITIRGVDNAYVPRIAPSSGFPSTTNGYSTSLVSNSDVSSAPAAVTAEGLEGGVYFASLGVKPHIGLEI